MPTSRYTARLTNLASSTTIDSLISSPLFTSKGLAISPGQTRISLATGLDETKIATVTFRNEAMLHRALSLGPQERMVDEKCIAFDAGFEGFTPLSDGEDIDVVAIHGLNGHAFDAWFWRGPEPTDSADDVDCFMWLRDSLSEQFPGARILLYGYNANTVSDVSTGRLRTFGETFLERLLLEREHDAHRHKPLILVAHSMGGLVLKQALTLGDTRADRRYLPLIRSIRAITFFGTPHQGANGITTGKLIANLLNAVNLEARGDLLKELERNSTSLFDLTSDFKQVVQRLGVVVYTMYEAKKTILGSWPFKKTIWIVTEQSAILGIANERKSSVNANHTDICKFNGPGDPAYSVVRQVLRELVAEMTPTVTIKDATAQPDPPPDLKYTNLLEEDKMESDIRKYPVLVWGKHTYWSLAHHDNRYGVAIIAYDKQGSVAGRWEKGGARYIVRVLLHRDRAEFVGQGGLSISFPLSELRISV